MREFVWKGLYKPDKRATRSISNISASYKLTWGLRDVTSSKYPHDWKYLGNSKLEKSPCICLSGGRFHDLAPFIEDTLTCDFLLWSSATNYRAYTRCYWVCEFAREPCGWSLLCLKSWKENRSSPWFSYNSLCYKLQSISTRKPFPS